MSPPNADRVPHQKPRPTCADFSNTIAAKREEQQARTGPQPWIKRKLVVGVVIGIIGYTYYVYVVRLCIPMVRNHQNARGSRGQGIAYLVIFHILLLMWLWAYEKIVLTAPGFARDHVEPSPSPPPTFGSYAASLVSTEGGPSIIPSNYHGSIRSSRRSRSSSFAQDRPTSPTASGKFDLSPPLPQNPPVAPEPDGTPDEPTNSFGSGSGTTAVDHNASDDNPIKKDDHVDDAESPATAYARAYSQRSGTSIRTPHDGHPASPLPLEMDALKPVADLHARVIASTSAPPPPAGDTRRPPPTNFPDMGDADAEKAKERRNQLPPLLRQPPPFAQLAPERRYCYKDGFTKPPRTHHCSVCGTCVLMYDHHCPWIGQCVGARNAKFFLVFNAWSTIFTLWVFLTLLIAAATHASSVDAQQIVIIGLAAFFTLFTSSLGSTHTALAMLNATTVERLRVATMKDSEMALLSMHFSWWQIRKKMRTRKEWDREWGDPSTEGNLWWLGSSRANWEARMGSNPWLWFLPVGKSGQDGLDFPSNPRFTNDGRWRRREEWPVA